MFRKYWTFLKVQVIWEWECPRYYITVHKQAGTVAQSLSALIYFWQCETECIVKPFYIASVPHRMFLVFIPYPPLLLLQMSYTFRLKFWQVSGLTFLFTAFIKVKTRLFPQKRLFGGWIWLRKFLRGSMPWWGTALAKSRLHSWMQPSLAGSSPTTPCTAATSRNATIAMRNSTWSVRIPPFSPLPSTSRCLLPTLC